MLWGVSHVPFRFGAIADGVKEFQKSIKPAHRGVLLYGQFCAFFATVSSAYYCTARFPNNFEDAALCSVNGGGQNTMRTSLVGALLGARVGLSGIPIKFLSGLEDSEYLISQAEKIADAALKRNDINDEWYWPTEMEMDFTIGAAEGQETEVPPLEDVPGSTKIDGQPSGLFLALLILLGAFLGIVLSRLSILLSPSPVVPLASPLQTTYNSISQSR